MKNLLIIHLSVVYHLLQVEVYFWLKSLFPPNTKFNLLAYENLAYQKIDHLILYFSLVILLFLECLSNKILCESFQ